MYPSTVIHSEPKMWFSTGLVQNENLTCQINEFGAMFL